MAGERINPQDLSFAFCDDWAVYAKDKNNNLYFVNTELWQQWGEVPNYPECTQEKHAIEKYMLPIVLKNWDKLYWQYSSAKLIFKTVFTDGKPSFEVTYTVQNE